MLDLSDMGEEDLSRAVSSEFKRLIEDNVDLPFLVDSLVVDGRALQSVFKDDDLRDKFCEISDRCPTVVACRLSPIQVGSRDLWCKTFTMWEANSISACGHFLRAGIQ